MRYDKDERRRRDMRDLEFYRRRLRPTASELWRLIDKPKDIKVITESDRQASERYGGRRPIVDPPTPTKHEEKVRTQTDWPAATRLRSHAYELAGNELIWPMIAAMIILGLLGWTGNLDGVLPAMVF